MALNDLITFYDLANDAFDIPPEGGVAASSF